MVMAMCFMAVYRGKILQNGPKSGKEYFILVCLEAKDTFASFQTIDDVDLLIML